jgi:hypothetical protein
MLPCASDKYSFARQQGLTGTTAEEWLLQSERALAGASSKPPCYSLALARYKKFPLQAQKYQLIGSGARQRFPCRKENLEFDYDAVSASCRNIVWKTISHKISLRNPKT